MKKGLKVTLIVLGVLIGIVALDTLQAKLFDNSPILKIRDNLDGGTLDYIDKGIFVNHYHCNNNEDVTTWKGAKFACSILEDNKGTQENDEHSFDGKIVESHESYIIVEPNEEEEERKISDKFRIDLGKNNDAIYVVGSNVKITYVGIINESYPAQIGTTKIELKSVDQFNLIFYQKTAIKPQQKEIIISKNEIEGIDYNIYSFEGNVAINLGSDSTELTENSISLRDALLQNKITMEEIIVKANEDLPNAPICNDGGSREYHYDNYTIIKFHTINGNRDVYIGNENLTIDDLKSKYYR